MRSGGVGWSKEVGLVRCSVDAGLWSRVCALFGTNVAHPCGHRKNHVCEIVVVSGGADHACTATAAGPMTCLLLVAFHQAGRRATRPTEIFNAGHHGGKPTICRRYLQNRVDYSSWCGRITDRVEPDAPETLSMLRLNRFNNPT